MISTPPFEVGWFPHLSREIISIMYIILERDNDKVVDACRMEMIGYNPSKS